MYQAQHCGEMPPNDELLQQDNVYTASRPMKRRLEEDSEEVNSESELIRKMEKRLREDYQALNATVKKSRPQGNLDTRTAAATRLHHDYMVEPPITPKPHAYSTPHYVQNAPMLPVRTTKYAPSLHAQSGHYQYNDPGQHPAFVHSPLNEFPSDEDLFFGREPMESIKRNEANHNAREKQKVDHKELANQHQTQQPREQRVYASLETAHHQPMHHHQMHHQQQQLQQYYMQPVQQLQRQPMQPASSHYAGAYDHNQQPQHNFHNVSSLIDPVYDDAVSRSPAPSEPLRRTKTPVRKDTAQEAPVARIEMRDSDQFDEVSSHIMLKTRKVTVTFGEMRRRMGSPERQNWKMLARLTRHATHANRKFEQKLLSSGMECVDDTSVRSDWTIPMLLEADAMTLALDFTKLLSELNVPTLAVIVAVASGNKGEDIAKNAADIVALLSCAKEYLLKAGRNPGDSKTESLKYPAILQFSLQTHGFGPRAVVAVIDNLIHVVNCMKNHSKHDQSVMVPLLDLPKSEEEVYAAVGSAEDAAKSASGPSKKARSASVACSRVDYFLIPPLHDDNVVFGNGVLPRIAYGTEEIQLTRGEIRRRVVGPEKMNASTLISYLRTTKKTDTNASLLKSLQQDVRINLEKGDKKGVQLSSWSALTEKEATAMASETGFLLTRVPPSREMQRAANNAPLAAEWLRFIMYTMAAAMMKVGVEPVDRRIETAADLHILRFAMISHHFGHAFYSSVAQWLQNSF